MSLITDAWERTRLAYQNRYAVLARKIKTNAIEVNERDIGALNEQSYVLITIFGLTQKQIKELESNDYCGLTNNDFYYGEQDP